MILRLQERQPAIQFRHMIWRVFLFCLLGAKLALADLPRPSFVASVAFCSNDCCILQKHTKETKSSLAASITSTWDARGNLVKVVDAATNIVGKAYDGAGNLIYLTNRNGHVWQFHYDGANRLTNTTSPLSHSVSQVYNNRGLLQSTTDALSQMTSFCY